MFLSTTVFLSIYRFVTLKGIWRVLPLLALLILLTGIGLTVTRAAFVALPLGLLAMVFCIPSRTLQVRLAGGLLLLLIGVTLLSTVAHVTIFQRFLSSDVLTLDGRVYIWQAVLAHFDPGKILGTGLKGSDLLLARLQVRDQYGVIGVVAHSMFLETLYDHGLIGLLLLLALFAALLAGLVQGLRQAHGEQRWLFAVVLGTFVSVLVQAIQLNDLMTDLAITSYFWIVMALPFAFVWQTGSHSETITASIPDTDEEAAPTDAEILEDWQGERVLTSPLRVCILSLGFAPLVGGSEKQAERHAHLLQKMGHEVLVVTLRRNKALPARETLHGLPIIRVGGLYKRSGQLRIGRVGYLPVSIALLVTLWRVRHRFDLLHVWQAFFPAAIAALFGYLFEKPVIVSIQNTGPTDEQRARLTQEVSLLSDTLPIDQAERLRLTFMDWAPGEGDITYLPLAVFGGTLLVHIIRRLATRFHVLSTRGYFYLTNHGFPAERIAAIPYGIDTERFQPAPQESLPTPIRKERKVVCVARLEYAKGIDILLHAWGQMMRTWDEDLAPVLQLVGDGSLRARLSWLAEQLGIQDSVLFLGTCGDVLELLHGADVFVLPSRWEGLPNALLEAMAAGLPCVATRVSGSEDVIADGVNGLLVATEEPLALAEALQRLLTDTELNLRLREAARASVVQGYQLSYTVGRALDLYYQLLAENKAILKGGLS
jgi:glycosyltransferase involved in cell wall biosynthesis